MPISYRWTALNESGDRADHTQEVAGSSPAATTFLSFVFPNDYVLGHQLGSAQNRPKFAPASVQRQF